MNIGVKVVFGLILLVLLAVGLGILVYAEERSLVVGERQLASLVALVAEARPGQTHEESQRLRGRFPDWIKTTKEESLVLEVARDLGIALIVAVVLTLVIESWARFRLQDEVRTGVVEAAFKRLIQPEVFEEIQASVIKSSVARRNWTIEMNLYRDDKVTRGQQDHYVSLTTVSYTLHNLTSWWRPETVAAALDIDQTSEDADGLLPRFESVKLGSAPSVEKAALCHLLDPRGFSYSSTVRIPPRGSIEIVNRIREVIKVPDTFVWNTRHQAIGGRMMIEVAADVKDLSLEVTMLHPDREQLKIEMPERRWRFEGALLPWQGFQVRTFRKSQEAADLQRRANEWKKTCGAASPTS